MIRNNILRKAVWLAGWVSLILGVIGIFLPLLPTTPFVLLAAACFLKSSEKTHFWLMNHPRFGPPLRDWQTRGAISVRAKFLAVTMIAISMLWMWYLVPFLYLKLVVTFICSCVSVFILTRPS